MPLKLYNSLTRQKEEFKPINEGKVGIYVCGPTVYGDPHVGHAKSYISYDVIVRYLRYLGYSVLYVQNITDVGHLTDDADGGEDKIIEQAKRERIQPMAVVEHYMRSYFEDMDKLNNLRPDISPRASGHIIEQIEMIKQLITTGHAYEADGSVYFDVGSYDSYGKLSGRSIEDMVAGTRVEARIGKRNPADFALWKKAEPGHIMQWPSPWGEGYPGWHIECSAMSMKYLGDEFDIHGGGIENQFPHHECEIAQSEAATGKDFVKYWLHNNMVTVNGTKMGKSLGNYITLKQAFEIVPPLVIRFFILQSHYRSPLDFSTDALAAAQKGYDRLIKSVVSLRNRTNIETDGPDIPIDRDAYVSELHDALDDDFNTPQAIASLFNISREVNQYLNDGNTYSSSSINNILEIYNTYADAILGIIPQNIETSGTDNISLNNQLIALFIEIRSMAREKKNFELSDFIRNSLKDVGIILEDTREGTIWKRE
jgi:cysteinyl-tRNA synthetase